MKFVTKRVERCNKYCSRQIWTRHPLQHWRNVAQNSQGVCECPLVLGALVGCVTHATCLLCKPNLLPIVGSTGPKIHFDFIWWRLYIVLAHHWLSLLFGQNGLSKHLLVSLQRYSDNQGSSVLQQIMHRKHHPAEACVRTVQLYLSSWRVNPKIMQYRTRDDTPTLPILLK